jgi:flagellar biosynthesis/type III secretory pathway chaperone
VEPNEIAIMTQPQAAIDWSEFDQFLQLDLGLSQQLLDMLQEERKALETREYAHFEELIGAKSRLIASLEQNTDTRRHWLQQQGFTSEVESLRAARATAPDVAAHWEQAATLWRDCQTANQINEQICRRTQVVVENVLDVLRGQHGQKATYNAQGQALRSTPGRTITSA